MYNLHRTEGIILSATDFGEADRIYNIYTKDFGKISVLARGIRLEKSKLRSHLGLYSLVRLSFIEGKEFMRLTDAEEILRLPYDERACASLKKALSFVERLIKGQEKDEVVWNLLVGVLSNTGCLTTGGFEGLFRARLLHRLGYVSSQKQIITDNNWPDAADGEGADYIRKIYELGLKMSQL
ncbi:MAG: DNA repair protein RecO [Candidatus Niyogibacteria bacterium]|nr:DNA repair protein RecO [Candidatus Niyogibacteria bacterium]